MNTTVPAVEAKLLALFEAATEAAETEVWPARTNEQHRSAENVYLGDVRGRRTYATLPGLAQGSREEVYEITVEVEVEREGTDLTGAKARMWEIAEALELTVAERPALRELLEANATGSVICTAFDHQTPVNEYGALAQYTFGVEVTARI